MSKFPLVPPVLHHHLDVVCVVCGRGGKIVALHNHHIIPRAFGGKNGPQITLCVDHHELIHDEAKKQIVTNPKQLLTKGFEHVTILSYLINLIVNAEKKTTGDPNKTVKFSCELPQKTVDKMRLVMTRNGLKSYSSLIRYIFDRDNP